MLKKVKTKFLHKKALYMQGLVAIVLVLSFFVFQNSGNAAATVNSSSNTIGGYAWADDIGWIALNGTTTSGILYGITVSSSTGYLTGYAWSDTIGWIKFGGLTNFPTGSGTVTDNAKVSGSSIVGWARACAGEFVNTSVETTPDNVCNDATKTRSDGWDGWISLSGTNYGITINQGFATTSGYAWGSDVPGWISFSNAFYLSDSLTVSPNSVSSGNSATTTWTSTGADYCDIYKAGTLWKSHTSALSATGFSTGPLSTGTSVNITLVCYNASSGLSATSSYDIGIIPQTGSQQTVSINASTSTISSGGSTMLSWNSTNANSCSASNDQSNAQWTGSITPNISNNKTITNLTTTTTFTLTCLDSVGVPASTSTTVVVSGTTPPPPSTSKPTISLSASSNTILYNATATLSWSVANAGAGCTAASVPNTPWNGYTVKAIPDNSSSTAFTLSTTTTFSLTCTNSGGSISTSTKITVIPLISISAQPANISYNGSTTLTWSSSAQSCLANAVPATTTWSGSISPAGGTKIINGIQKSTDFVITCLDDAGNPLSATATVSLATVHLIVPCLSYQAGSSTSNVTVGQTMNWNLVPPSAYLPPSGSTISSIWSGTDISGTIPNALLSLPKIYSTVGTKTINDTTTVTVNGFAAYVYTCSNSVNVVSNTSGGGEI
jgi:hypothetical protein